jgi:hypothetical protein
MRAFNLGRVTILVASSSDFGTILLKAAFVALLSASSIATADIAPGQAALNACAIDLCGDPSSHLPKIARGPFENVVPNDVDVFLKAEIDPKVSQLIQAYVKMLKIRADSLDRLISASAQTVLSDDQKAFLAFAAVFSKVQDKLGEAMEPAPDGTQRVNPDKLIMLYPDLRKNVAVDASAMMTAFYNSKFFSVAESTHGVSLELWFDFMARAVFQSVPVNSDWVFGANRWLLDEGGKIQDRLGPFVFANEDISPLKKILAHRQLSDAEKSRALDFYNRLYLYEAILSKAVREPALRLNFSIPEAAEIAGWRRRRGALQGVLSDHRRLAAAAADASAKCRKLSVQALAAVPSDLRKRQTLALIEKLKSAAKAASSEYFDNADLASARAAIDRATFDLPPSMPEVRNKLRTGMAAKLSQRIAQNELEKAAAAGGANWISYVTFSLLRRENNEDGRFLEGARIACDVIGVNGFRDRAYSDSGALLVGWQTAMFPEVGAGIIAHEFGHLVSGATHSDGHSVGYLSARACSAEMHAAIDPAEFQITKTRYAEEDWADAFASTTLRALRADWPYFINYSCESLPLHSEKSEYLDPRFESTIAFDAHSASLLRALQAQIGLGWPIPESCKTALGPTRAAWAVRSCAR